MKKLHDLFFKKRSDQSHRSLQIAVDCIAKGFSDGSRHKKKMNGEGSYNKVVVKNIQNVEIQKDCDTAETMVGISPGGAMKKHVRKVQSRQGKLTYEKGLCKSAEQLPRADVQCCVRHFLEVGNRGNGRALKMAVGNNAQYYTYY